MLFEYFAFMLLKSYQRVFLQPQLPFLVKTKSQSHLASLAPFITLSSSSWTLGELFPNFLWGVLKGKTYISKTNKQTKHCLVNVRWSCWLLMTSSTSRTFADLFIFSSTSLLPKREQSPCAPLFIITPRGSFCSLRIKQRCDWTDGPARRYSTSCDCFDVTTLARLVTHPSSSSWASSSPGLFRMRRLPPSAPLILLSASKRPRWML